MTEKFDNVDELKKLETCRDCGAGEATETKSGCLNHGDSTKHNLGDQNAN